MAGKPLKHNRRTFKKWKRDRNGEWIYKIGDYKIKNKTFARPIIINSKQNYDLLVKQSKHIKPDERTTN